MKARPGVKWVVLLLCGTALTTAPSAPYRAEQTPPALQISSPTAGTLVNAGQTISVTVTSPAGTTFAYIAIEGPGGPIGSNTSVPATFSLTIPFNISPRTYTLGAVGRPSAGPAVFSKAVPIAVERADQPTRLSNDVSTIPFRGPGDVAHLRISGTFADGTNLNVTESGYMSFSSLNAAVVTVSAKGFVKAVGPGRTVITATYGQGPKAYIPVSVGSGPIP